MSEQQEKVPEISLQPATIANFWRMSGVPLTAIINAMERCENWTVDGDEQAEEMIAAFEAKLSDASYAQIEKLLQHSKPSVIRAMAYLGSGRAILLYRWLSMVNPGSVPEMISYAAGANNDECRVLVERIQNLERLRILSRIFAPERLSEILETLEQCSIE